MKLAKTKKFIAVLTNLSVILMTVIFSCGYGYTGDLPVLGKNTKPQAQNKSIPNQPSEEKYNKDFEFPGEKIYFPRIYSNYDINRYDEYLKDIKQIEHILTNLKHVVNSDKSNKIQQFSAKVNVLNLHVCNLKEKYGNKPEKNYESFKQLVILDKYLTEAADYHNQTSKYRNTVRGSLVNKLEDESYMRKKVNMSSNSIDAVLKMIQNSN